MPTTDPGPLVYPGSTTWPGTSASAVVGQVTPYTTPEILTVDGVVLNTYSKQPTNMLALLRTPGKRNNDVTVPGRHGSLRTRTKYYDYNTLTIPFWVQGNLDNGTVPGGSSRRVEFQKRIDELTQLFMRTGRPLDVRITRADGTIRQCFAEVLDVMDFTQGVNTRDPYANFVVTLTMADPFWSDIDPVTFTITPGSGGNQVVPITSLAGTTAPIVDSVITLTGPWNTPYIEAYVNGAPMERPLYFQYNGLVASGKTLIVDCSNWTVGGTMIPLYSLLTHVGGSRFMEIQPSSAQGTPQLYINGGSINGTTKLSVSARRKFLVG